ncbi:lantibiotic dehydratase [Nonomuraea sp. MTCD27]|uniref:lantibiotic dehydratase n=1 Tax=Nonomuraea sp. MTCD27 TaxID=1676747 RepID=UPI0035C1205E
MGIEHDWTLLPAVVVRSAGFPWELVLSLVHPRAAEAAAAVVRLERQALDLLDDGPGHGADAGSSGGGRPPRGFRGRLRALRPLPPGSPGPDDWLAAWNDVTGQLEEARLTLAGMVAGDAALVRAAMAGIVADERFLDALVCSSPGLYRDLRHGAKGSEMRRQVAAHVQRLSASCETEGCYGPLGYGAVEAGAGGYTWAGHRECDRRVAFAAARVEEALQQRVLADPALVAGLVPRRRTWTGEAPDGAAFAGHCDGRRTLAEIAAETGTGLERASAALAVAVRRGLLTHDLCPPATVSDTLGWLRERLAARGVPVVPGAGGNGPAVAGEAPGRDRDGPRSALGGPPGRDRGGPRGAFGGPPVSGRGRAGLAGACECGLAGPFEEGVGGARSPSEREAGPSEEGAAGASGSSGRGAAGAAPAEDGAGGGAGEGAGGSDPSGPGGGGCGHGGAREVRGRGLAEAPGVPGQGFVAPAVVPERGDGPAGVPAQREHVAPGHRVADADLPLGRRVGEIGELLWQYPAASPDVKLAVQRRIEALAGGGQRDDRVIVHEAAAGTLRVTVGDALAADLESRVPRVLDLLAEEAELTRLRTNRLVAGRLGAGTFPLAEALRATGDLEIEHGDRLARRVAAIVRDAPVAAELNLAGLLDEPAPPAVPVLCSADVMVAAPSLETYEPGVTPLVLSRLHDAVLLTPWALQFHEERAMCLAQRDTEIRLALSGFTVLNVISRRSDGVPPLELPGPVLELGGVAADPGRRRIGLDELYVHSDGQRALLYAKGLDEPLLLHNGGHDPALHAALHTSLHTALHTALALPRISLPRLHGLARVPRLTWDNVVVSGRRWRVGRSSFEALGQAAGDRELLVAMARLREDHDLPVAFFASSAREREPVYVDTRAPALLEGLARLAAMADEVTVTEVPAGPDECWLREGEQRFAAELRCVYLRPARKGRRDGHRDPGRGASERPGRGAPPSLPGGRHEPAAHPYPWPGGGC